MSAVHRQMWELKVDALSCFPNAKEAFRQGLMPQAPLPGAPRDDAWWNEFDRKVALFCARAESALSNLPDAVGQAKLKGVDGDANLATFVRTFRQKRMCFFEVPLVAGWKGHTATSCSTQLTPREALSDTWVGVVDRFEASLSGANGACQRTSRARRGELAAATARAAADAAAVLERTRAERVAAEEAERAARREREDRERREREDRERDDRRREREDREARDREDRKREREERDERDARAQAAQQATFAMMLAMLRGPPAFEAAPSWTASIPPPVAAGQPPAATPPPAPTAVPPPAATQLTVKAAAAALGLPTSGAAKIPRAGQSGFGIISQL